MARRGRPVDSRPAQAHDRGGGQDGIEWPKNGLAPPRTPLEIAHARKLGMLNHSGVHSDEDVDHTLEAFEATLDEMRAQRLL